MSGGNENPLFPSGKAPKENLGFEEAEPVVNLTGVEGTESLMGLKGRSPSPGGPSKGIKRGGL